jgi:hypothetical protein
MRFLSNILFGNKNFITSILVSILLSGCANSHTYVGNRIRAAERIGERYHFTKRIVKGDKFWILTYQKITNPNRPFVVYLEGDGFAFRNKYTISDDPTPLSPMVLKLAGLDDRPNVVYISRPCQYILDMNQGVCYQSYWTDERLSNNIVTAINDAILKITGNQPVSLVGFSSGGGMAILIAARNPYIKDIITIAGALDHKLFTKHHNVRPMLGSLNPIDYSSKITKIPQMHLSGGKDKIIPPFIADKFVRDSNSPCVHQEIIPDATHNKGWEESWGYILGSPVRCYTR